MKKLTFISASNPEWVSSDHIGINLIVKFEEIGEVPFHAMENDSEIFGQDLYRRAVAGEFGEIKEFQSPILSLDDAKTKACNQVNLNRDELESSGFMYLGYVFDSNAISVQRISNKALSALTAKMTNTPFSVDWTVKDNSIITLDADQMIACQEALTQRATKLHQHATSLKTMINAAISIDEVNSVDIVNDWPALS